MKSKAEYYHYFFSYKQKKMIALTEPLFCAVNNLRYDPDRINTVTINGKTLEYTEMCKSKKPFGSWDDYIYLGKLKLKEAQ